MTRFDLLKRLENHLAGESALDAVDLDQRVKALEEARDYISEKWELDTRFYPTPNYRANGLPNGDAVPDDFLSWAGYQNHYNIRQPPLLSDSDTVWAGHYPTAELAISYYAAFRIMEDRGPEMYERAAYWKQRFDQIGERLDQQAKRRNAVSLRDQIPQAPFSMGYLRQQVSFNLGQGDMTPEERHIKFPETIIDAAINRAYMDITDKFELNSNIFNVVIPSPGADVLLPFDFGTLSATYAMAGNIRLDKVAGSIRFLDEGEVDNWQTSAPTFRIVSQNGAQHLQVSGLAPSLYPVTVQLYVEAKPYGLVVDTDVPWSGMYNDAIKLIVYKAMRDMMCNDPKTYNMSRFWQNEYDREEKEFKRLLRRQEGGSKVALWGYSRMGLERDGFIPINAGDSRNNE